MSGSSQSAGELSPAETSATIADDGERLRLLVDAVVEYAIFLLAPDGTVMTWNPGAARLKGYTAGEIVGRHFSTFYPPEDIEARKPEHELVVAARDGSYVDDGWRVRKDGTRFWAHVVITALYEDGKVRGFAKVTRDDTAPRSFQARAEAVQEITSALLEQADPAAVLELVATHARTLSGAARCWIASPDGDDYVVRAASGGIPGPVVGERFRLPAELNSRRPSPLISDLPGALPGIRSVAGFGAALVVNLRSGSDTTGILIAAAAAGPSPFRASDAELLQALASQAALVLRYRDMLEQERRQELSEERERVAHDLHELVITELFATGLSLEGTTSQVESPEVRHKIEDAVNRLDDTIRRIRTSVFRVGHRA